MIKFLVRFLCAFVCLVSSSLAFSVTPDIYYQMSNGGGFAASSKTDYGIVCAKIAPTMQPGMSKMGDCKFIASGLGGNTFKLFWGTTAPYTQNVMNGGTYQCSQAQPYFNETTQLCSGSPNPTDCSDKNKWARRFYYTMPPYTAPDHFLGCKVTALEMLGCRTDPGSGLYCVWTFVRTGELYTDPEVQWNGAGGVAVPEDKTQPQTSSPQFKNPTGVNAGSGACPTCVPCPLGTVQIGFDSSNIPICVGTGTEPQDAPKTPTTTTSPTTTTNNADGSTDQVSTVTQTNSDGSTTTTTTTTHTTSGGTKTVSQTSSTSNTASGAPGKADNPAADQANLCKQNPNLSICMTSTVSGSCGTISCTGDAIQCATLRAAAQIQCQQAQDQTDLAADPNSALGKAIASGNDQTTISNFAKGDTVDLSSQKLDQTGWLGGGQCLQPISIQFSGHVVTATFDSVCSAIQPIRAAVLLMGFIIAYLTVSRSVLQS